MFILSRVTMKTFLNFIKMAICEFLKKWVIILENGWKMVVILFLLMAKKSFVTVKYTESHISCSAMTSHI